MNGRRRPSHRWLLLPGLLLAASLSAAEPPPAVAVATAHPLATRAGIEILQAGGNAFDAAVAISAALAVVEPTGSGLGGGGFWLLHRARDGLEVLIDGREVAPGSATGDMYLQRDGTPDRKLSLTGPLAAGIPGEPAALVHLSASFGRLSLEQAFAPAIRYAEHGFAVDAKLADAIRRHWQRMSPAAQALFAPGGRPLEAGERLRQVDLAWTLRRLAAYGTRGFYQGRTAELLLAGVRADGGIWNADDLRGYRVIERRPMVLRWRGHRIVAPPLPSAGGVALAQSLPMLDELGWPTGDEARDTHLLVEVWRRVYRDRAEYLGDPAFTEVPLARILSMDYLRRLARGISPRHATPSASLPTPGATSAGDGPSTTHFSVLDAEGNHVSATLSINLSFGSGYMPPGTGVLLNDEMDDFVVDPMVPNAYGLVGTAANAIRPGKRMLSSMTPSFVDHPQRGLLLIGTPGGSRIVTMVMLGLLDYVQGGDLRAIIERPRFHHQYLPDRISHEPAALPAAVRARLVAMGHSLQSTGREYGNMQLVHWDRRAGRVAAASDPRGVGAAEVVGVTRLRQGEAHR